MCEYVAIGISRQAYSYGYILTHIGRASERAIRRIARCSLLARPTGRA